MSTRKAVEDALAYLKAVDEEIEGASDRAAAILASAILDNELAEELEKKFVLLSAERRGKLFGVYGPLSSLSAKIDIGFAVGLFGPETHADLHRLRRIRNKFAHTGEPLKFSNQAITDLCATITNAPTTATEPRSQYMETASLVGSRLRDFAEGITPEADRLP